MYLADESFIICHRRSLRRPPPPRRRIYTSGRAVDTEASKADVKAALIELATRRRDDDLSLAAGPDAPAFEDRWADVINKIRAELQKYKRW
jgi:hypothetical protein